MEGRLAVGWWRTQNITVHTVKKRDDDLVRMKRFFTQKASNRAAVHGTKRPLTDSINEEEAEKEISKGKEEKEKKREQMDKTVDSHLNNHSHNVIKP